MAVINVNLFSMALKHNMDCTVIFPQKISSEKKLKCIWLYHGASGDHTVWLYHTPIVEYVEERQFAVVLPNVNDSCFVDMNIGEKYGTYVGMELPKTLWQMFRCISNKREDNYVAGFSNGGYGCFHTAFSYPQYFSRVGAFSAGDKADAEFKDDDSYKSQNRIRLYGKGDIHHTDYSFIHLANNLIDQNVDKPSIYHACGGQDPWLYMNHIVRDYFLDRKEIFDYTYDEIPELGHEWKFWNIELQKFLDYCGLTVQQ
jgi:S-formylglutathione hydrolase FrmB